MNGLGDVFGSLQAMTQLQLLMAFVACIGYAFAQGRLLSRRGRRLAWSIAALAAGGFAFEYDDWTHAIMLLAFAVAGMGSFVAMVWLTGRALAFDRAPAYLPSQAFENDAATLPPPEARTRSPLPGDHAHST